MLHLLAWEEPSKTQVNPKLRQMVCCLVVSHSNSIGLCTGLYVTAFAWRLYLLCNFFFFFLLELGTEILRSPCSIFLRLQLSQASELIHCAWEIDINMTLQLNTDANGLMAQHQSFMLMNCIFNSTDLFMYFYYFCGNQEQGQWHWGTARAEGSAAHSSSEQPQATSAWAIFSCCSTC